MATLRDILPSFKHDEINPEIKGAFLQFSYGVDMMK